jgi:hypothetical protein
LEFEGNAIYLHQEDFQQALTKNALWVDIPKDMTRAQIEAVNDHYVICTGTFVAAMFNIAQTKGVGSEMISSPLTQSQSSLRNPHKAAA